MKLAGFMIFLIVLQISMGFMNANTSLDSNNNLVYYNATTNVQNSTSNMIWDFLVDPTAYSSSNYLAYFLGFLGLGSVITLGIYLVVKTDTILLSPILAVLIGFGALPLVNLYLFMTREVGAFACATGSGCVTASVIGLLTAGVIALMYTLVCIEWWVTRQNTT